MFAAASLFDTRVALRVFGSFIAAAVVPLIATGVLVQTQVSATLETRARDNLDEVGDLVSQQMLDRLLLADDAVRHLAEAGEISSSLGLDAALVIEAGQTRTVVGEPFTVPYLVDENPDKSTLSFFDDDGTPTILLSSRVGERTAVGRVDSSYLWNASAILPYGVTLCVLHKAELVTSFLFCSESPSAESRAAMRASVDGLASNADLGWSDGDSEVMARMRELFIESRFEATPWKIVTSQDRDIALAALGSFNRIFPFVLAGSLLLTLLLSSVQIRRIMQPLKVLVSGTKLFANREFEARVELEGDNEFSELADAMNDMATSLGRQFATISALAEIDRLILSSQSIAEVLDRILERVAATTPGSCVSILLLDPDQTDRAQLFSRSADSTGERRLTLPNEARTWLTGLSAAGQVDAAQLHERLPELPPMAESEVAIVVPIYKGEELRGALVAERSSQRTLTDDERERLFEYASRLAVAVSSADHESELFQRAHFDTLTGLPNRQLCYDRLNQAIAQARREEHRLAVLFIDLDRFKNVNDSLGHSQGDELLKEVSFRLTASVRETDTVARLGGDEYVVILPHIEGVVEVETIVAKIFSLLHRPFNFTGQEINISASIGVTIFPDHATDAESLLQKADTAMYAAKDDGRARIEFFEEEMDRSLHERLQLQRDLRIAIQEDQFNLMYQPQLELSNGKLIGMETLLRWHHPERGQVSPAVFVPILEDMGLIGEVGRWIIDKALATHIQWRQEGLCLPRLAINVSGKQLLEKDFEAFVVDRLRTYGVDGSTLELEITEHTLIEDVQRTNQTLIGLAEHGIRIAIDDFGTGYSSLGYLQGLQFDVLKIDRAFVQGLPNSKSVAIVEAVLGVANALGKEVVAEGIDTDRQLRKLVELGCGIGQGFLLSVPIIEDEVLEWSARLDETSVIEKLIARRASA